MRILIKCHPKNQKRWRWLENDDNEVWFASDRESLARIMIEKDIQRAILVINSIEDAPVLDYLYRYHPEVQISLVTNSRIRAAIQSFRHIPCELIDSDDPQQIRNSLITPDTE